MCDGEFDFRILTREKAMKRIDPTVIVLFAIALVLIGRANETRIDKKRRP